jgi:Trypsin-co-occurring domain 2
LRKGKRGRISTLKGFAIWRIFELPFLRPINGIDRIRSAFYSLGVGGALRSLAISCISCLLLQSCATSGVGTGSPQPIPLNQVVQQVTSAFDQFRNSEYARLAKLDSAEFNFQTVKGTSGELSVKPLVFNFGFSASREVTHTFTFTYRKRAKRQLGAMAKENDMTRDLVEMIEQAARAANGALYAVGLPLNQVDLSVQFAVKKTVTGGGAATIQLVTLGGSVTASRAQTQSVKLTFKRK